MPPLRSSLLQFAPVSPLPKPDQTRPNSTKLDQTRVNQSTFAIPVRTWCLPTQAAWINNTGRLRIWEKSRQVGATKTDALDSVLKASPAGARLDVWVTSRDDIQARLYLEDCVEWARILHVAAENLGVLVLEPGTNASAYVLQFASGRRIYCLSSNPPRSLANGGM
jgi:phage FluMu gp28-like protein